MGAVSTLPWRLLIIATNCYDSRARRLIFCCTATITRSWRAWIPTTKVRPMQRSRTAAWVLPLLVLMLCEAGTAHAKPWWMRGVESNDTDFLPPDVAFRVAARLDGKVVKVRWVIADGYYLYRQKIEVKAESPDLVVSATRAAAGYDQNRSLLGHTAGVHPAGRSHRALLASRRRRPPHSNQGDLPRLRGSGPVLSADHQSRLSHHGITPRCRQVPPYPWESAAIVAGAFAFLLAGLVLRKGRKLDIPA